MSSVKLLTANLFKKGANAQALANVLGRLKPEILAVQELTALPAEVIAAEFAHTSLSPFPDGTGIGLAARRPVTWSPMPMPHRPGIIATLEPNAWAEFGGPVDVVGVHFINPIEWSPWTTHRIRRGQVEAIMSYAARTPRRQVICGDLNATPAWPAYRQLMRYYRDGVLEANARKRGRPASTWAPSRAGPRLLRIDHVLVSGLSVTTAETVRVDGSDHLAVLADLADDRRS